MAHLDFRLGGVLVFLELWGRLVKGGVRAELENVEINCLALCDLQIL